MNILEKRKNIEALCQNLDEKIFATIKQCFPDNENTVYLDAGHLHANYNIDEEEEYKDLIYFLKQHQKEPDLYTLEEIIRTIDNASVYYSHNDDYINWLKEFIKNNIDIYQKLD